MSETKTFELPDNYRWGRVGDRVTDAMLQIRIAGRKSMQAANVEAVGSMLHSNSPFADGSGWAVPIEDAQSTQAEPPSWMGYCRRCESGWQPTPMQNVCLKCGAGPLTRLESGEYAICTTIYPPEQAQEPCVLTPATILERLDAIKQAYRQDDMEDVSSWLDALRSELRAQIERDRQ